MELDVVRSDSVGLDDGTFMWVKIRSFAFQPDADDLHLLAALTTHREYRWDFATLRPGATPEDQGIHGPYRASWIGADSFELTAADSAQAAIEKWADEPAEPDPQNPGWAEFAGQSAPTHERLRSTVYPLLRHGSVYRLAELPEAAKDEMAFVGSFGFHEFVIIDHERRQLHLVVASDD